MGTPAEQHAEIGNRYRRAEVSKHLPPSQLLAWFAVSLSALGCFLDIFDLGLFAVYRIPSLTSLGYSGHALTEVGAAIFSFQLAGFVFGGLVLAELGDRRKLAILFGSNALLVLSAVGTSFISSAPAFAILRFFSGFALSGELGIGVALVAGLRTEGKRRVGVILLTAAAISGAIAASIAGGTIQWRQAYFLEGAIATVLFLLRTVAFESGESVSDIPRPASTRLMLRRIVRSHRETVSFVARVFAGVPIYFVFGLLVMFSPEIASALGITASVSIPRILFIAAVGAGAGDVVSRLWARGLKNPGRPMAWFIGSAFVFSALLCNGYFATMTGFTAVCGVCGFFAGYWSNLLPGTSEPLSASFGAASAAFLPSFVRASGIVVLLAFLPLREITDTAQAAVWIALAIFAFAYMSLHFLHYSRRSNGVNTNVMRIIRSSRSIS